MFRGSSQSVMKCDPVEARGTNRPKLFHTDRSREGTMGQQFD